MNWVPSIEQITSARLIRCRMISIMQRRLHSLKLEPGRDFVSIFPGSAIEMKQVSRKELDSSFGSTCDAESDAFPLAIPSLVVGRGGLSKKVEPFQVHLIPSFFSLSAFAEQMDLQMFSGVFL